MSFAPPNLVFSVVYVSRAIVAEATPGDDGTRELLADIQSHSRPRNATLGLRGVLLLVAGHFLQWLEGPQAVVLELMEKISKDSRHVEFQTLYTGFDTPVLSDWSMSLVTRAEAQDTLVRQISLLRAGNRPRIRSGSMPAAILRSIIKPSEPVGQERGRKRILLIGQAGVWPAALMASLASTWGMQIVHTRVVGSLGPDRHAIVEYLDYDHPSLGRLRLVNRLGDLQNNAWLTQAQGKLAATVLFYSVNTPEALSIFSEQALSEIGENNRFAALMCLFGRTATPLVEPVQDWFASQGRQVTAQRLSLADAQGIWAAIEQLLAQAQTTDFLASDWQPSAGQATARDIATRQAADMLLNFEPSLIEPPAQPPAQPLTLTAPVFGAPAPVDRVVDESADVTVEEVAVTPTAVPLLALTAFGHQWLSSLLEIEAARAVGVAQETGGPLATLIGYADGDSADFKQQFASTFNAWLASETAIHARLARTHNENDNGRKPHVPADDEPAAPQQILTRYSDHFCISVTVPVPAATLAVVLIQFADDYVSQGIAQSALQAALRQVRKPLFETA